MKRTLALVVTAAVVASGCATFRKDLDQTYESRTIDVLVRVAPECDDPKSAPLYDACDAAAEILSYRDPRTATVAFLSTWEEFVFERPANTRRAMDHDGEPRSSPLVKGIDAAGGIVSLAVMHGDSRRADELVNVVIPALREVYARAGDDPYAVQMSEQARRLSIWSSASLNAFSAGHALALHRSPRIEVAGATPVVAPVAVAMVSDEAERAPAVRPDPTPMPRPAGSGPVFLRTQRAGLQEVEAGRRVEVTLAAGDKLTGTLTGVEEYGVTVETESGERILAAAEIAQVYRAK